MPYRCVHQYVLRSRRPIDDRLRGRGSGRRSECAAQRPVGVQQPLGDGWAYIVGGTCNVKLPASLTNKSTQNSSNTSVGMGLRSVRPFDFISPPETPEKFPEASVYHTFSFFQTSRVCRGTQVKVEDLRLLSASSKQKTSARHDSGGSRITLDVFVSTDFRL